MSIKSSTSSNFPTVHYISIFKGGEKLTSNGLQLPARILTSLIDHDLHYTYELIIGEFVIKGGLGNSNNVSHQKVIQSTKFWILGFSEDSLILWTSCTHLLSMQQNCQKWLYNFDEILQVLLGKYLIEKSLSKLFFKYFVNSFSILKLLSNVV